MYKKYILIFCFLVLIGCSKANQPQSTSSGGIQQPKTQTGEVSQIPQTQTTSTGEQTTQTGSIPIGELEKKQTTSEALSKLYGKKEVTVTKKEGIQWKSIIGTKFSYTLQLPETFVYDFDKDTDNYLEKSNTGSSIVMVLEYNKTLDVDTLEKFTNFLVTQAKDLKVIKNGLSFSNPQGLDEVKDTEVVWGRRKGIMRHIQHKGKFYFVHVFIAGDFTPERKEMVQKILESFTP